MDEDLPTEYDLIVVGTGLVESVVAAAASRIGKKVLHLDGNSYYGHFWSTFNLDNFEQWLHIKNDENNENCEVHSVDEQTLRFKTCSDVHSLINVQWKWFLPEEIYEEPEIDPPATNVHDGTEKDDFGWTHKGLKKRSQKFNIDLSPKMILSKGPMVELLIRSGVSRYTEFISIHNVLLYINSVIESVPFSKSDVFSSRTVSVIDKRILMKLLLEIQNFDVDSLENSSSKDETFYEYLRSFRIPENIEKYILYSIAGVSKETSRNDGIKAAQLFLSSLGVYGNSPFLWPLYGSSELVQAFCRLCAVYGGIYCLNRGADEILIEGDKCLGIFSGKKKLFAQNVVMPSSQAPSEFFNGKHLETISRGILITNKSLYTSGKKGASLLQFPSEDPSVPPVSIIELDSSTLACPDGLCIVHLMKKGSDNDFKEFDKVINELFEFPKQQETAVNPDCNDESNLENSKPSILFKLFFMLSENQSEYSNIKPQNLHLCSGPVQFELDFISSLKTAEGIFREMYPEEEFLPAPVETPSEEE